MGGLIADTTRSLGTMISATLSKYIVYPTWDVYDRSAKLLEWRRLEHNQWDGIEIKQSAQRTALQKMVEYARDHCDFYARRLPSVVSDEEDFRSIPILQKDDVRERWEAMRSKAFRSSALGEATTGGSTSKALRVWFDKRCQERRNAVALRCDRWSGWDLGEWRGALWGNPPEASTWRQRTRERLLDRTIYLDTVHMSETAMAEFLGRLRDQQVHFLFGHSHSLYVLANFAQSRKIRLDIRGIVSTSMMLLAHERAVIERAFRCPVLDRYGCEEVGLIACECERHCGMHVNIDHQYVEVLRDDGTPAEPGEAGRIVVTDLINHGMPLIRYEVGDVGSLAPEPCPCGRGLPMLAGLQGRVADFLVRMDGSLVAGVSLVERTLTAFAGLDQLQIVQEEVGKILLNVVSDSEYNSTVADSLVREIQRVFGPETQIRIARLASIPQENNGKYRFAICRVPHRYTARDVQ